MRRPRLIYASNFRQFGRGTFVVSNTLRRLPGFDVRPIHATGGMMRGPLRMPAALLAGHLLATWFPDALILGDSARGSELAWRIAGHGRRQYALRFGGVWTKGRPIDGFAQALQAARLIIVPSQLSRASLEEQGGRQEGQRIVVVPNGVDTNVLPVGPPSADAPLGLFTIGQLEARKQPELAISTLAQLTSAGRRATLDLFGGGEPASYIALAQRLGVADRVSFHGLVQRPWDRLPQNPVLLHAAKQEGFGLAVAEGLVRRVPTYVIVGSGGPEEMLRLTGGGRICLPDAQAISAAILSDFADLGDLMHRLQNSRNLACEEYSNERMLARYRELLMSETETVTGR